MMKRLPCLLLALVLLCGCTAAPAGTTTPATTVPATTTGPVLKAGYYVPVNEEIAAMLLYIQLLEDGSGFFYNLGTPTALAWTPAGGDCCGEALTPTADGLVYESYLSLDYIYAGDTLPEGYLPDPPATGVYAVSSVSRDGDLDFCGSLSRDNGWFELKADGTGVLVFDDVQYPFTMEGPTAHFDGWDLMLLDMSADDPEGGPMVMVYVMSGPIRADSIAFRLMEGGA